MPTPTAASTKASASTPSASTPTPAASASTRLLEALCAEADRHGLYKLTSRVFADNHATLAAHRAAGFEQIGIQRRHGRLDGVWKDCVLVERLLGAAAKEDTQTDGRAASPMEAAG